MGRGGERAKKSSGGAAAVVSGDAWDATVLAPQDEFIAKLDLQAFRKVRL